MKAASIVGTILDIAVPALKAGAELLQFIRNRKDAGDVKLKDIPGFENWKKDAFSANYTGFLEKLREKREENKE